MAANLNLPPRPCALPSSPSTKFSHNGGSAARRLAVVPSFRCQGRDDVASDEHLGKSGQRADRFARILSRSQDKTTASVAVPPPTPGPPPSAASSTGSPLFWIGVGVGLSALFSFVASQVKKYAMQQAFKAMMGPMNTQNNQFPRTAFRSTSPPSPFTMNTSPRPPTPTSSASQPSVIVDVPVTKVEAVKVNTASVADINYKKETKDEPKKYAFVDVSPDESNQKSPFEISEDTKETTSSEAQFSSENGAASWSQGNPFDNTQTPQKGSSGLSVDALEKMMEDPTVQKMVYLYLPEEMRNPETFKWMLQNPQYRQQLEEMLNNMGGSTEWDSRMMDSLKNFDLSSPEVKQQFDQIGLTPEEVISKIMANPEVAMAFQNPRVQQAIMDCSQNPLSIAKYQNDKEVMDVFNKISELFPGVNGS
ncbi:hypothetical protein MLD38_028867 [Melastoma candidum]|uniref:Uncharacterized protein n=1 Tax=Melastoma candidum TaxID=119954 RepID=A0ACB9N2C6_9MYRT|nr:hypothetical protein MLD38_028867 [Melastoma candidum]